MYPISNHVYIALHYSWLKSYMYGTHREKNLYDAAVLTTVIFFHFKMIFG